MKDDIDEEARREKRARMELCYGTGDRVLLGC